MSELERIVINKRRTRNDLSFYQKILCIEQNKKEQPANARQLELCLRISTRCGKFEPFDKEKFKAIVQELFMVNEVKLILGNLEYFVSAVLDERKNIKKRIDDLIDELYSGVQFYPWVPRSIFNIIQTHCSEMLENSGRRPRIRSNSCSSRRRSVMHHERNRSFSRKTSDIPGWKDQTVALALNAPSNPPSLESDSEEKSLIPLEFRKELPKLPKTPSTSTSSDSSGSLKSIGFLDSSPALDRSLSESYVAEVSCIRGRKRNARPKIDEFTFDAPLV
jgi:hypothetical protein